MGITKTSVSLLAIGALALGASACGGSSSSKATTSPSGSGTASELHLGYFATVTHATAVYGVASGMFQKDLGSTTLKTDVFKDGPTTIEALRGGSLDAAFLGPNPAINGFTQTDGKLLRIVAGTTSGGASLVVKKGITDVSQLAGKTIDTPQLGNTQDVAAKYYFKSKGIKVNVNNVDNSTTLDLFKSGKLDGAWVPEPYASRMVNDDGGTRLIDEKSLWPNGQFDTTELVVTQKFLTKYPATVKALLQGLIDATDELAQKKPADETIVNNALDQLTGKPLKQIDLTDSFNEITPTIDPIASSIVTSSTHGVDVGVTKQTSLKGLLDLSILNQLLTAAGKPTVSDAGLGVS